MTTFHIQKDQHDFRPRDGFGFLPWFWIKDRALTVAVEFDANCLYDFGDDPDSHDWAIKLPGLSLNPFWQAKNHQAAMVAARSNPDEGWMEVTAYFNHSAGQRHAEWDKSSAARGAVFAPGEQLVYILWPESRTRFGIRLFDKTHGGELVRGDALTEPIFFEWETGASWLCTPIGLWFGSNRTAPQQMSLRVNKAWVRQNEIKHLIANSS